MQHSHSIYSTGGIAAGVGLNITFSLISRWYPVVSYNEKKSAKCDNNFSHLLSSLWLPQTVKSHTKNWPGLNNYFKNFFCFAAVSNSVLFFAVVQTMGALRRTILWNLSNRLSNGSEGSLHKRKAVKISSRCSSMWIDRPSADSTNLIISVSLVSFFSLSFSLSFWLINVSTLLFDLIRIKQRAETAAKIKKRRNKEVAYWWWFRYMCMMRLLATMLGNKTLRWAMSNIESPDRANNHLAQGRPNLYLGCSLNMFVVTTYHYYHFVTLTWIGFNFFYYGFLVLYCNGSWGVNLVSMLHLWTGIPLDIGLTDIGRSP